jgi:hypothetical protein
MQAARCRPQFPTVQWWRQNTVTNSKLLIFWISVVRATSLHADI